MSNTPIFNITSPAPIHETNTVLNENNIALTHQIVDHHRVQQSDQLMRLQREKDIRYERRQQQQIRELRRQQQTEMARLQARLEHERMNRKRQIETTRLERQQKREQCKVETTEAIRTPENVHMIPMVTALPTNTATTTGNGTMLSLPNVPYSSMTWNPTPVPKVPTTKPRQQQPNHYWQFPYRRNTPYRELDSQEEFVDSRFYDDLLDSYDEEKLPLDEKWEQHHIRILENSGIPEAISIERDEAEQLQNIDTVQELLAEQQHQRDIALLTMHERSELIHFLLQESHEPHD